MFCVPVHFVSVVRIDRQTGPDERLTLAAQVARAAPDATLPLLRTAAEAKKHALSTALSTGADPTVPLEELWWLARLIPHVLADPFDGEIPLPPDPLAECTGRATRGGVESPVDTLSTEYVSLACQCLDEGARRALSPRLMETLAWGAARWADTYLMPEDTGGSLHAAMFAGQALGLRGDEGGEGRVYRGANKAKPAPFSEAGGGAQALDALLRVSLTTLTAGTGTLTGTGGTRVHCTHHSPHHPQLFSPPSLVCLVRRLLFLVCF